MLRRLLTLSNGVHSKERERERERERKRERKRGKKKGENAGILRNGVEVPSIIFHMNALPTRRFFLMTVLINIHLGAVASSCLYAIATLSSPLRTTDNFPRE